MSCQTLTSDLGQDARPRGGVGQDSRPRGALGQDGRPRSDGFCRTFDFGISEGDFIVTISVQDFITTISGDRLIRIG